MSKLNSKRMKELEKIAIDKWPESFKSVEADFTSGAVDFLEYTVEKPLARIRSLRNVLRDEFVQRNDAIDCCLASLISGVPALLIGPPGVAKSMVIRQIKKYLGENAKNFEYLLTKFTTPEELFGAAKLEELKQGSFIRDTKGKIPEADLVFIDEVFRGSSQILNTLLTISNEKIFHNPDPVDIPLLSVIGATNSANKDPELEAFYDRFPIRLLMESVFEEYESEVGVNQNEVAKSLLQRSLAMAVESESKVDPKEMPVSDDFRLLGLYVRKYAAANYNNNPDFINIFLTLRKEMEYSDRTLSQVFQFGIAHSMLSEETNKPKDDKIKQIFKLTCDNVQHAARVQMLIDGISNIPGTDPAP